MAAPKLNRAHQQDVRMKIQTTQLVNRLQCFALGKPAPNSEDGDDAPLELDQLRLKAIEILLRKSLPDLSTVTLQGDEDGGPIKTEDASHAKLAEYLSGIASRTTGQPS